MNDASEVLSVIFDCLHRSFICGSSVSDAESAESNCMGSWDCANGSCIAHSLFGMNIFEQMNCYHCGLESRHLKYTSFFHNINASALRTMKVSLLTFSFKIIVLLIFLLLGAWANYYVKYLSWIPSSLARICLLKVPSISF